MSVAVVVQRPDAAELHKDVSSSLAHHLAATLLAAQSAGEPEAHAVSSLAQELLARHQGIVARGHLAGM